jgi:hypothetical protein
MKLKINKSSTNKPRKKLEIKRIRIEVEISITKRVKL